MCTSFLRGQNGMSNGLEEELEEGGSRGSIF